MRRKRTANKGIRGQQKPGFIDLRYRNGMRIAENVADAIASQLPEIVADYMATNLTIFDYEQDFKNKAFDRSTWDVGLPEPVSLREVVSALTDAEFAAVRDVRHALTARRGDIRTILRESLIACLPSGAMKVGN